MSLFASAAIDKKLDQIFKTSVEKFSRIAPPEVSSFAATESSLQENTEVTDDKIQVAQETPEIIDDKKLRKKLKRKKSSEEEPDSEQPVVILASTEDELNPKSPEDQEKLSRTIFVGNVPAKLATDKTMMKEFKAIFQPHGTIESMRFRSVAFKKPSNGKMRKVEFIKGDLHEARDSMNAYIVYKNMESAEKALTSNAVLFEGKHLRVDLANGSKNHDHKRSIFVGNLAFDVTEEEVWSAFSVCGEIQNVRIIRDKTTNVGKGFGYVLFRERSSTSVAMQLNDSAEIKGRKVRVTRCVDPEKRSAKKQEDMKRKKFEGERGALRRLNAKKLNVKLKNKKQKGKGKK